MRIIALRPLHGTYGDVVTGQEFDVDDVLGARLLKRGLCRKPEPPQVLYETKIVLPEADPNAPFCERHLPHAESPAVAPESDPVLPPADVPKPRASGGRRRGGSVPFSTR